MNYIGCHIVRLEGKAGRPNLPLAGAPKTLVSQLPEGSLVNEAGYKDFCLSKCF